MLTDGRSFPWRRLMLAGLLLASLAALGSLATADTGPPASGDWTVGDVTTVQGTDVTLSGWLFVNSPAHLTLRDLTLTMNGTSDGQYGIVVNMGGRLTMRNVTVRSSDPDVHYWFECWGMTEVLDCNVRDVASNAAHYEDFYGVVGGIQIYNYNAVLRNTTVHDCQRIGVYIYGVDPLIEDCTFSRTEYVCTDSRYGTSDYHHIDVQAWYTDATGLYLLDADPTLKRCAFEENGIPDSALPFYNASFANCMVITYGRGCLAVDSAPVFEDCSFSRNGLAPGNRQVEGIAQIFFDLPFGQRLYTGGLVSVLDRGNVTCGRCEFTGNDASGLRSYAWDFKSLIYDCSFTEQNLSLPFVGGFPGATLWMGTGGNSRVEVRDSRFWNNSLDANVYCSGPSLSLVDCVVNGSGLRHANVFTYSGELTIINSTLDVREQYIENIQMGPYYMGQMRTIIRKSAILGGVHSLGVSSSSGVVLRVYDTVFNGSELGDLRFSNTDATCINCTFSPTLLDPLSYNDNPSVLRLAYYVRFRVTWQSGVIIDRATVYPMDKEGVVKGYTITGSDGWTPAYVLETREYRMGMGNLNVISITPWAVVALKGSLTTNEEVNFSTNAEFTIVLKDYSLPQIIIRSPFAPTTQANPFVTFSGYCLDTFSGMDRVEIRYADRDWYRVGDSEWNVTLELEAGAYELWVRAFDVAGNNNTTSVGPIVLDFTPPMIRLEDTKTDTYYTREELFNFTFETEAMSTIYINGRLFQEPEPRRYVKVPVHLAEDGTVDVSIEVVDPAGRRNHTIVHVVRDTVPPVIHLETPYSITNTSLIALRGWVLDDHLAAIDIRGRPFPFPELNLTIRLEDGFHVIVVTAWDKAGNLAKAEWRLQVDTTPPVLEIQGPADGAVLNQERVTYKVRSGETLASVLVDGRSVGEDDGWFVSSVDLEEGDNTVGLTATDLAGNTAHVTMVVTLDTVPPVILIIGPGDGALTREGEVEVTGNLEGASRAWVNGLPIGLASPFSVMVQLVETPPGGNPNLILVEAEDAAGNTATLVIRVYRDTLAPVLRLEYPEDRVTSDTFRLSGTLTDGWGVSHVTIDGVRYNLGTNGSFSATLPLEWGDNRFNITGFDLAGNEHLESIVVERYQEPEEPHREVVEVGLMALMLVIGVVAAVAVWYVAMRWRHRGEA